MGKRSTTRILHWSWWRRWHQAWARFYHDRQRQGHAPLAVHQHGATTQPPILLDVLWQRLAPWLPPPCRTGRPYAYDRRLVLEAIVYGMHADGAWRTLSARFPPWQTVYAQFARWRRRDLWETLWAGLGQPYAPR